MSSDSLTSRGVGRHTEDAMRSTLWVAVLLAGVLCQATASLAPRPYVFGMNIAMTDEQCRLAKDAGCTCVRIGCGWDLVEKRPGVYDWSDPDRDVQMCRKWGFEPFFLVVATPRFYLAEGANDKVWGRPALEQFHPQAARFYRTLAERYKGKVRYYEFWNEQNGYGWHAVNRPEEYAPILKVAYRSLKGGDPNCQVAIGGLDGAGWKGYYHYLEKLYELGCGDYFDAVAVHPYRADGPIDVYGLKKIREVLVNHGHSDRKVWITEYGWSKEYGHVNKAKWLTESLDLLTSPDLDFVFQASVHTLSDFDETEYGLCDRNLNPRPAYCAFKNYQKDWAQIAKRHARPKPPNLACPAADDFEDGVNRWTGYGDGLRIRHASSLWIRPETGSRVLGAAASRRALSGGAYRQVTVSAGAAVYAEARVYTDQRGSDARNSRVRVGIDPTGACRHEAATVVWGRWIDTSGEWDTAGVGRGGPIVASGDKITVFLDYKHCGGPAGQISAFDNVEVTARRPDGRDG